MGIFDKFRKQKRSSSSVNTPEPIASQSIPIDLDRPVENPKLTAILEEHGGNPSITTLSSLLHALNHAHYLVATMSNSELKAGQSERSLVPKGTNITMMTCCDQTGARFLALFTDWDQIQKWASSNRISAMVMPAKNVWDFCLQNQEYEGAVINPAGHRMQLGRDQIKELLSIDGSSTSHKKETHMQVRPADDIPAELVSSIRQICEDNVSVDACILLDARLPESSDDTIHLFIEILMFDPTQFDAICEQLAQTLSDFPEYAAKTLIGSTGDFMEYLPNAIYKKA